MIWFMRFRNVLEKYTPIYYFTFTELFFTRYNNRSYQATQPHHIIYIFHAYSYSLDAINIPCVNNYKIWKSFFIKTITSICYFVIHSE